MFPPKRYKSKNRNIKSPLVNDNINELTLKKPKTNKQNIKFNLPDSKKENVSKNNQKYEEILEYNDTEINSLLYQKAIQVDIRTFSQYYLSLLRQNHLLVFYF